MRSRVYALAQATKHASTQCVCKSHLMCMSHPDFPGEQFVQDFAIYTRVNTSDSVTRVNDSARVVFYTK